MSIQGIHKTAIDPAWWQILKKDSQPAAWLKAGGQRDGMEDNIGISEKSRDFARIRQWVDAQPEIRQSRVAALAEAIDQETYTVPGQKIADALIRKNLIEAGA